MNLDNVVQFPAFYAAESQYISSLYKKDGIEEQISAPEIVQKEASPKCEVSKNSIVQEIEKAREQIKSTLSGNLVLSHDPSKIEELEKNQKDILAIITAITSRLDKIELSLKIETTSAETVNNVEKPKVEEDEEEVDLFGSDEEDDEENERLKEERIQMYNQKKSTKAVIIAKSNIILDVKPWDDETDMAEVEAAVRSIVADGLLWGSSKLVPLAYGIKKLQISCVVVDDKIGTDFLEEKITEFEDLVQSVDIAAFNKI